MLLATKTKNEIKKRTGKDWFGFNLKNIIVNGQKRGCSGFVFNPKNGVYVYLYTEPSVCNGFMYCRYAKDFHDYTGARNHNVYSEEELLKEVVKMLMEPDAEAARYCA